MASPIPQQANTISPTKPITPAPGPKSIAIITCSTRPGRINPSVSAYILSLLTPLLPSPTTITLTTIDLTTLSLPLFNELTIPAALDKLNPTPHYLTPHARAWSTEISKHDAFIFVTPQYNWSMPASIKNALDYLYWEWSGKPAFVVSYGGHGGGKSKEALENVLRGLKMRVISGVEITVKVPEVFVLGEVEGEGVKVVGEERREVWKGQGVEEGTHGKASWWLYNKGYRNVENFTVAGVDELIKFNEDHAEKEPPSCNPCQDFLTGAAKSNLTKQQRNEMIAHIREVGCTKDIDALFDKLTINILIRPAESAMTQFAAATGHPIASLPLGYFDYNGRPHGLAAIAKAHQESTLTQLQRAWETPFPTRQALSLVT